MMNYPAAFALMMVLAFPACNSRGWDRVGVNGQAKVKLENRSNNRVNIFFNGAYEGTCQPFSTLTLHANTKRYRITAEYIEADKTITIATILLKTKRKAFLTLDPP